MLKKTVSALLLTLLLLGTLIWAFNVQPVRSDWTWIETIYIRADGSVDPDTAPISTVDNITYTLKDNIVGNVPFITSAIVVERDNIVVDGAGHTLQGEGVFLSEGISLTERSNVTIKNTEIKAFYYGIRLASSSNNAFSGNNIANNFEGIGLASSSNNALSSNNITANNLYGIRLRESSNNNSISGNNITNNDDGIRLYEASNNIISGNNITANNEYGIYLSSSLNNNISGNNITVNNKYGCRLDECSNNTISGNNITANNEYGIGFVHSDSNSICMNNITNNDYGGIFMGGSSGNTVSGNNVMGNRLWPETGIRVFYGSLMNSISGNNLERNFLGIWLEGSSSNTICENEIRNNVVGIRLAYFDNYETITGNNVENNDYGIFFGSAGASNNTVYQNNFVGNGEQVYCSGSKNVWDDGYPSGGNYWDDHVTVDECCGVNQDEPGSDGIVDEPYIIDDNNRDHYPLVEPWSPVVSATVDVDPDTLNLESKGQWLTAYLELPEGYNAEDIDATTISLNETIQPVLDAKYDFATNASEYLVDHDGAGILERMVKFNRTEVTSWIHDDLGIEYGDVVIEITGELLDGTPFEGTDTIKVLLPGDADDDGDVDANDLYIFSRCHGMNVENPSYNPLADFNEDGYINSEDLLILSENYGRTTV